MNRAGHGHQKHNSQSEKTAGKSDEPSDLSGDRDAFPVNGGGTKGAPGENWGGSVESPLRIHVPAMPAHLPPRLSTGKLRNHGNMNSLRDPGRILPLIQDGRATDITFGIPVGGQHAQDFRLARWKREFGNDTIVPTQAQPEAKRV
jgi:hypothetical protein